MLLCGTSGAMKATADPMASDVATESTSEGARSRLRTIFRLTRYLLLVLLLGAGVHILLPRMVTFEHALQVIRQMVPWAVALGLLMQVLGYLGIGYLLRALVGVAKQRLTVGRATAIFAAASSVGLVGGGPVGSIAATYRWMRASGVSRHGAALAGPVPVLFIDAALLLMGVFGVGHLLIAEELSTLQIVGFALILAALVAVVGAVAWATRHRAAVTGLARRAAHRWARVFHRPFEPNVVEAGVRRWFRVWDALRDGGWRRPALGALLYIGCDMLSLNFIFLAARYPVSLGTLLAGYGLPLLLGKVSFLPGGLGIVEATMAALYDSLGVPNEVSVVVILVYRFLSYWLPLLLGFPLIPYLQRISRGSSVEEGA